MKALVVPLVSLLAMCDPGCVPTPAPPPPTSPPTSPPMPPPVTQPPTTTTVPHPAPGLSGALYVADNPWQAQAQAWGADRPADAAVMAAVGKTPMAVWLGPFDGIGQRVRAVMDDAGTTVPVFVLYGLPDRDLGGDSAGGAAGQAAYRAFVDDVAWGIGAGRAIVIVEPDALMQGFRYQTPAAFADRLSMMRYALAAFGVGVRTYVDTANARYVTVDETVAALTRLGGSPDGFSTNVSFHATDAESVAFGHQVSARTGLGFVVDTSRSGAYVVSNEWCNTPGRRLGRQPTLGTGDPAVHGYLWIKVPGESDGICGRGEPAAGTWWPDEALRLAGR